MRRASFYIGLVILGTVGPFALASWALEVVSIHLTNAEMRATLDAGAQGLLVFLSSIAVAGLLVAVVESRAMATALLGARMASSPAVGPRRIGPLEDELLASDRRVVHRRDPGRESLSRP